ncbi:hypothetical protein [Parasitella parasitica]|uniref:GDP/GTP exchange factor Sec2 N-terminal domain-containing protein n=1 Tax=Parasitella parasitica TaxID=35722 RepID=A0A0B7NMI0_9FUNG|nr:hypothetical protein [Parasitella parasitica]
MTDNIINKIEMEPQLLIQQQKEQPKLKQPQTQLEGINSIYNELGTLIRSKSTNDVRSLSSISSSSSNATSQSLSCTYEMQIEKQRLKERTHSLAAQLDEKKSLLKSYHKEFNTINAQYLRRKQQNVTTSSRIEDLKQDILFLKTKHEDEIAHSIEIEQSKIGVETELHDLSQKLFEEANALVLEEKKEKLILQQGHDQVKLELESINTELNMVQGELQTLREAIANQPEETTRTKSTHDDYTLRAKLDIAALHGIPQPLQINRETQRDTLLLQEFDTFIKSLKLTSFTRLNSLPFMKHCIRSDIAPCLKRMYTGICRYKEEFTFNQKQTKTSNMETLITVKRAITIVIMLLYLWERNERRNGNCRDRISSVISFYSWLRQLKVQDNKMDLNEAYEEFTRLRLQMLLSRMGALSCLLNHLQND